MSTIKEIRMKIGVTQKEFAGRFHIPLSTVKNWESARSIPAPYIIDMITELISLENNNTKQIIGQDGSVYFVNYENGTVTDKYGDVIRIEEDFSMAKEGNLAVFLTDLFQDLQALKKGFVSGCKLDSKLDVEWI